MDLVHQLDARTHGPASGCPAVVMVQSTHDRTSNHLVPCILRGSNRSEAFRNLLRNPLMGSCPIEVGDIGIEHALELLLIQDQQVVQAFLSDAPQKAFANGIGSGSVTRGLEKLDATGRCHSAETGSILAVVITDQILGCLPIRGRFPELLRYPGVGRSSCHDDMDPPSVTAIR